MSLVCPTGPWSLVIVFMLGINHSVSPTCSHCWITSATAISNCILFYFINKCFFCIIFLAGPAGQPYIIDALWVTDWVCWTIGQSEWRHDCCCCCCCFPIWAMIDDWQELSHRPTAKCYTKLCFWKYFRRQISHAVAESVFIFDRQRLVWKVFWGVSRGSEYCWTPWICIK